MSDVLGKCISNSAEFTKAFNIMISLNDSMKNSLKIIEETEITDEHIGNKLKNEFESILLSMSNLVTSRRSQFLDEAMGIYKH